ncbi:MAG: serine--tRNA ligase [Elusimicrobia bacterium]|jgi:seryl-tRNA synthetase|nr:serine--tRNA ligase [Elusimicrobiota bacterium]
MLDIKRIRSEPDVVRKALQNRGGASSVLFEQFLVLDSAYRATLAELEPLRARRNQAAGEVGLKKRQKEDVSVLLKELEELKTQLKGLEERAAEQERQVNTTLLEFPNLPLDTVPLGSGAAENVEERRWGTPRVFSFVPKDHQELGEKLGLMDFTRAAKISGARFSLLTGMGARLERALINFMLDLHTNEHGYTEIVPPYLVTRQTMTGTGQLPKFEDELYATKEDDLFLIPTAEVPLTNMFRDEDMDAARLPRSVCAYTACFRRESGSYGKDTRGLTRNHQFNKIELVRFVRPEDTATELDLLTGHAETVLKRLGLPYRVMALCTGDVGFSSAKTYDLEVWAPGENSGKGQWREISSCSTFTDFQARRIGLRYKKPDGSKALLHTLNGSGVAVGRTMAALLENYQEEDGVVTVPEALRPYTGFDRLLPGDGFR